MQSKPIVELAHAFALSEAAIVGTIQDLDRRLLPALQAIAAADVGTPELRDALTDRMTKQ